MGIGNFSGWDGATYKSKDGTFKIKAVAARQGVTDAILRQRFGAPPSEIAGRYSGGSNPNSFAPNLTDGPGEIARPAGSTASQATLRARAAGIDPYGYDGGRDASGRAVDNHVIQRGPTVNRAQGTGAVAPVAPVAPMGTGAVRPSGYRTMEVKASPTIPRVVPQGDPRREKELADELANLWDYMKAVPEGGEAWAAYKRRVDAIESEQRAAQQARGIGSAPGAFGSAAPSPRYVENYPVDESLRPAPEPTIARQAPATVGERRDNLNPGGPGLVWTGTGWESADAYTAQQAKAAAPSEAIIYRGDKRPAPAPAPPAPTRSDYVPPTTSAFAALPGFDQPKYAENYIARRVGEIGRGRADDAKNIREAMAARGFTQGAAVSGMEEAALRQAEIARSVEMGRARNEGIDKALELGRTDAIQRAGAIDNYGLARGGLGLSYARDNRDALNQETMLPLDAQIKVLEAQGINLRNAGLQVDTQGKVIQNAHNQAILDFYKGTRDIDMTRLQQGVDAGALDLQKTQNELEILRGTTAERIAQIKAAATAAGMQNERTRIEIDNAIAVNPTTRATAEAQLREIEQRIAIAKDKQDWAMVDQLGKIAGRVAKSGGFKIAGGFLGAIAGPAGAAIGAGIGGALDMALGG